MECPIRFQGFELSQLSSRTLLLYQSYLKGRPNTIPAHIINCQNFCFLLAGELSICTDLRMLTHASASGVSTTSTLLPGVLSFNLLFLTNVTSAVSSIRYSDLMWPLRRRSKVPSSNRIIYLGFFIKILRCTFTSPSQCLRARNLALQLQHESKQRHISSVGFLTMLFITESSFLEELSSESVIKEVLIGVRVLNGTLHCL